MGRPGRCQKNQFFIRFRGLINPPEGPVLRGTDASTQTTVKNCS